MKYLDDYVVGEHARFGSYTVTTEEIKAFASRYDPQPFHLDEAAGRAGAMGVFCASGWHTAAMTMRMMVEWMEAQAPSASLGSPGVDELRWLRPVVPGDVLHVVATVLEVSPSRSRPDMGSVRVAYEVRNQDDEPKMRMVGIGLFKRRVTV
jgi:acyl dehydratase